MGILIYGYDFDILHCKEEDYEITEAISRNLMSILQYLS